MTTPVPTRFVFALSEELYVASLPNEQLVKKRQWKPPGKPQMEAAIKALSVLVNGGGTLPKGSAEILGSYFEADAWGADFDRHAGRFLNPEYGGEMSAAFADRKREEHDDPPPSIEIQVSAGDGTVLWHRVILNHGGMLTETHVDYGSEGLPLPEPDEYQQGLAELEMAASALPDDEYTQRAVMRQLRPVIYQALYGDLCRILFGID